MIIVTGGAGFIGSAIISALNGRGIDDILVVDILGNDEKWKNLRALRYADYVEAPEFLAMLSADKIDWDVEAVFHMGACSDTTETDCSYLVNNNYEYSKVVAQWATKKTARFIYASSAATYGDGLAGFSDDTSGLEMLKPLNMYGYSKHMFDLWAKRAGLNRDGIAALNKFFVDASDKVQDYFQIETFAGEVEAYTDRKVLIYASRPPKK